MRLLVVSRSVQDCVQQLVLIFEAGVLDLLVDACPEKWNIGIDAGVLIEPTKLFRVTLDCLFEHGPSFLAIDIVSHLANLRVFPDMCIVSCIA